MAARSGIATQDELAARAGVDRSYLNRALNGKTPLTDELAEKLARVLAGAEPWDIKPDYGGTSPSERRFIRAYRRVPRSERERVLANVLALLESEREWSAS